MTKQDLLDRIEITEGAELTNRLIPGDENFEFPEWAEYAVLDDGTHVRIYYRTTLEDSAVAAEFDWSAVDWPNRIERVCAVQDDGADGEDLLND